jgi:hypothetical protein
VVGISFLDGMQEERSFVDMPAPFGILISKNTYILYIVWKWFNEWKIDLFAINIKARHPGI